jgi:phage shock protein PspC (stress-responsive transcriptional regulator)
MEHETRTRRLVRTPDDKVVAGVCGGLGRYFDIDPVVFRIAMVVLTIAGGSGVLLYLIFWVAVPQEGAATSMGHDLLRRGPNRSTAGFVLLAVAALVIVGSVFDGGFGAALLLMAAGIGLLVWKSDGGGGGSRAGDEEPYDDPYDSSYDATYEDEYDDDEEDVGHVYSGYVRFDDGTITRSTTEERRARPTRASRPRSYLGRLTIGAVLLALGVLAIGAASDAFEVGVDTALAIALLITGLGLVVGAWFGRARGLILLGILLTLLLAAASIVDVPLRGGVGERDYMPATFAEVRDEYRLLAGEMLIDLSNVDFPRRTTEVEVSAAVGEVTIIVPDDVDVRLDIDVDAGEIDVFGEQDDGVDIQRVVRDDVDGRPATLELRVEIGAGTLEVDRAAA